MYFLAPFSSIWYPDSFLTMLCNAKRVSKGWASPLAQQWFDPLGWEDPLGEGIATNSSILAWRISRTEEPGGLLFIGRKELDMTEVTEHAHMLEWMFNIFKFCSEIE